jgi:hypothetical protein
MQSRNVNYLIDKSDNLFLQYYCKVFLRYPLTRIAEESRTRFDRDAHKSAARAWLVGGEEMAG